MVEEVVENYMGLRSGGADGGNATQKNYPTHTRVHKYSLVQKALSHHQSARTNVLAQMNKHSE